MAVLARPQLDGSSDVTERLLLKIGCREWVDYRRSTLRSLILIQRRAQSVLEPFAGASSRTSEVARESRQLPNAGHGSSDASADSAKPRPLSRNRPFSGKSDGGEDNHQRALP